MYEIAEYDKRYRPYNKSGEELKYADFVKLPVKQRGKGLAELLRHRRGLQVFAIWCLLLEEATDQEPQNRGKLLNRRDKPASISEIAAAISLSKKAGLVEYALSVLVAMGWVVYSPEAEESSGRAEQIPTKLNKGEREIKEKEKRGEFVSFTRSEYQSLVGKFGQTEADERIAELDDAIGSKGYKYKSHYRTILNWHRREQKEKKCGNSKNGRSVDAGPSDLKSQQSKHGNDIHE